MERPARSNKLGESFSNHSRPARSVVERVTIDAAGRIVVPASIRRAADFRVGQTFTISLFGEAPNQVIEMRTIESAIAQAQARMRQKLKGRKTFAVDDLIASRRAEALKEE